MRVQRIGAVEPVKDVVGTVAIGVPVLNTVTEDGIITALQLEEAVILGMTWGAWFKVGMFVALALLITERGLSIRDKLRKRK